MLTSVGSNGQVFLWDSVTGEKLRSMKDHNLTLVVWAVAFSPDGRKLTSCSGVDTRTYRQPR
ncbi:hypothetical protein HYDPIDRAFT_103020 [Hydnomerulius pinastri MD-312]|uniref:Unplaced genomic scaffold scaffold_125, whole genome shotgun sequence n=1 Tax=Hydnomerulius pinastri MD-312 TaxID=994086 RepID=A0A0C9UZ36_9AGAM|nr:hypothetical protein HYDPIDRAFT_103020 [Hydnomerulius pinastri MD-312]